MEDVVGMGREKPKDLANKDYIMPRGFPWVQVKSAERIKFWMAYQRTFEDGDSGKAWTEKALADVVSRAIGKREHKSADPAPGAVGVWEVLAVPVRLSFVHLSAAPGKGRPSTKPPRK